MVTKYINQPLGMGHGSGSERENLFVGVSEQKLIWPALAMAGASLASSLIGGLSASSAAKDAEERQRVQEAKEEAWYRKKYNENWLDTAAGQALVNRAREVAKENWKRAAGAQAVGGGTDASVAMAKEAGNKMMGDTLSNIAVADQQRKENVDNQHHQAQEKFAQMDMNREMQRAQNITQASQGASNALLSAAGALGSANAGAASLKGGSNGGVDLSKTPSGTTITGSATENPTGNYLFDTMRRLNG